MKKIPLLMSILTLCPLLTFGQDPPNPSQTPATAPSDPGATNASPSPPATAVQPAPAATPSQPQVTLQFTPSTGSVPGATNQTVTVLPDPQAAGLTNNSVVVEWQLPSGTFRYTVTAFGKEAQRILLPFPTSIPQEILGWDRSGRRQNPNQPVPQGVSQHAALPAQSAPMAAAATNPLPEPIQPQTSRTALPPGHYEVDEQGIIRPLQSLQPARSNEPTQVREPTYVLYSDGRIEPWNKALAEFVPPQGQRSFASTTRRAGTGQPFSIRLHWPQTYSADGSPSRYGY